MYNVPEKQQLSIQFPLKTKDKEIQGPTTAEISYKDLFKDLK